MQVDVADCDADTALHAATSTLHFDVITRLCQVLPDEDLAKLLARPNSRGRSPLHCTFDKYLDGDPLYRNNPDSDVANTVGLIVDLLGALHKKLGVSIDLQDSERATPLLLAAKYGVEDVVRVLLDAGAAPNVATDMGETPLTAAAAAGALEVLRMLLEAGADPHQTVERTKETALHLVVHTVGTEDECVSICKDLLDAGSDVNALDAEDKSPIAWAAEHRREKLVCCCIVAWCFLHHIPGFCSVFGGIDDSLLVDACPCMDGGRSWETGLFGFAADVVFLPRRHHRLDE